MFQIKKFALSKSIYLVYYFNFTRKLILNIDDSSHFLYFDKLVICLFDDVIYTKEITLCNEFSIRLIDKISYFKMY